MIPSRPSATSRTASRIGHDREHDLGGSRHGSRRVGPSHAGAISVSAFSRDRLQPVTSWPAAISRGTISGPWRRGRRTRVSISILLLVGESSRRAVTRI